MTQLEFDMLTVQPMYLYPDDIAHLREHHPYVLKDPKLLAHHDSYEVPPPIATVGSILNFIGANGWHLVKNEFHMEADAAVCAYRKEKYLPLLHREIYGSIGRITK